MGENWYSGIMTNAQHIQKISTRKAKAYIALHGIGAFERMAARKGYRPAAIRAAREAAGYPVQRRARVSPDAVLAAIKAGADHAAAIAEAVGCSESAARAHADKLAHAGLVRAETRRRYDAVQCDSFGGMVSCVRRART